MRVEDCYYLGRIRKPHGIHGELKVFFDVEYIEDYQEQESVYVLRDEKLTPVFITRMRITGPQTAIVQFRDVLTDEDTAALSGLEMYLPLEDLPPLGPGEFYYHDIVGFQVSDRRLGELGAVLRVQEMPAQDLLVVDYRGTEVLIPMTDAIVPKVDMEARRIETELPDGLLDVYN